jgi:hypothetical protein
MKINTVLHTDGSGLWSSIAKQVTITDLIVRQVIDEFGELRVYFTEWNVTENGNIYTDMLFLRELQEYLLSIGLSDKVEYSEMGMQGDDYVSLDVGKEFLESWHKVAV